MKRRVKVAARRQQERRAEHLVELELQPNKSDLQLLFKKKITKRKIIIIKYRKRKIILQQQQRLPIYP